MYSPDIVARRLHKEKKAGNTHKRLPREDSIGISTALQKLRYDGRGKLLPDGQLIRPLMRSEEEYVDSERIICKCDFEYFFTRYYSVELDPGVRDPDATLGDDSKIGPPILLESQRRYITLLGRREDECREELRKYKLTHGILAYFHKVRQVAATATVRGMTLHRMLFWSGTRSFAASLDDDRVGELFKRDQLALAHLPFWLYMKPYPDVKDKELGFPNNSRISYQAENQQNGIGTGSQVDVSHLTEVALWGYPGRIRYSFVPAIPRAATTLHVQESTADGKGNYWHEVTEAARHKRRGYENWIYAFIPWYMNRMKYRDNPPDGWTPEEHTIRHAELIERTSPEFYDGKTVRPSREQLYWWETARAMHAANGELASFLTNYPATPEQSFQSPSAGALPVELIEQLETETMLPGAMYEPEIMAVA